MKNSLFIGLILLVMSVATKVTAQTVVWQSVAMACVPTSNTVSQDKYVTTAGVVKFKPERTGRISFICPVNFPLEEGEYYLGGRIKTPFPDLFGITLQLRKKHNVTGAVETVLSVNSVQRGDITNEFRFSTSAPKRISFDFEESAYWVQITYSRNNGGTASLSIASVQLTRM